jgi:hypothetical protein
LSDNQSKNPDVLAGSYAKALLIELSQWGNVTTIILHAGCVFEFKGLFPAGEEGSGFYNLHTEGVGFEGHINLDKVSHISFQVRPHRGNDSYAFVFESAKKECIFKVFVGRDAQGQLLADQVEKFKTIQNNLAV